MVAIEKKEPSITNAIFILINDWNLNIMDFLDKDFSFRKMWWALEEEVIRVFDISSANA